MHVNRTLMYLRRANLVSFQNKQLTLIDRSGLEAAAGFNPDYLHLQGGSLLGRKRDTAAREPA